MENELNLISQVLDHPELRLSKREHVALDVAFNKIKEALSGHLEADKESVE